ncbi:hypothetical protein BBJ28_00005099 [Nothophytophthora sp. Chile5]|nr:hypothetical protein BBJ28_00005099 [Nothophytophthora sp. Chile5]
MEEPQNQGAALGEWKRRFQKETKVRASSRDIRASPSEVEAVNRHSGLPEDTQEAIDKAVDPSESVKVQPSKRTVEPPRPLQEKCLPSLPSPVSKSPSSIRPAPSTPDSDDSMSDDSNQMEHDQPRQSYFDSDDTSLDALFKYAVVLAGPATAKPKPKPRTSANEVQELEGLLEICFPYGEEPPLASDFSLTHLKRTLQERHRTYRSLDSTFVLTIASARNPTEVTYAICVRCPLFPLKEEVLDDGSETGMSRPDAPTQCCLCLLSPYPFFGLFFKVLYGIAVLWAAKREEALAKRLQKVVPASDRLTTMLEKPLGMLDFVEVFQGVMERLKQMPIPSMGGWTRMVLSPKVTHLAFHRPHSESMAVERRHLLLEYAAPTLFGLLSVDQVLFLLGCLCCERKVLVVSDHVNIVSSCVLALITLLHPLQWAGPVITVLPPRLDELLEAPVPLIAGRVSINSAAIPNFSTLQRPMRDVIEMNMDQNNLRMHDEDLMRYHELKLPECDELVHELEPFSSQLFGKHRSPDFPTVQQDEACKIMCARIHRHIESICTLALAKESGMAIDDESPGKRADRANSGSSASSSSSRGSITLMGSHRRCSAMVADYIHRFQETQMFSMFSLLAQDAQDERDQVETEHDSNEDDDNDDDEEVEEETYTTSISEFEEESAEPEVVG